MAISPSDVFPQRLYDLYDFRYGRLADFLAIKAAQQSSIIAYPTRAELDADLAHGDNTAGLVLLDDDPANNCYYIKSGVSGEGEWTPSKWPFRHVRYVSEYPDLNTCIAALNATGNKETLLLNAPSTLESSVAASEDVEIQGMNTGFVTQNTGCILTMNGTFRAGYYQVFDETAVVIFGPGSIPRLPAIWFGAKGDGVTTDNDVPINSAIAAANGAVPVTLAGTYLCSGVVRLDKHKTKLIGSTPGFIYGPTPSATSLKFTAGTVGVSGYNSSGVAMAYLTIKNITIDGNGVLDYGFDGGFFNELNNCTLENCNVAGMRIENGQFCIINRCGFNGNLDGLFTETGFGTLYVDSCVFRDNTRHGINLTGQGGVVQFGNNIIESNAAEGLKIEGSFVSLQFRSTYYENNDGGTGNHQNLNITPFGGHSTGIVFFNDYYSTVGTTAVATIAEGVVSYQNCTLVAPLTTVPVTITGNADVTFNDSFNGYADIGNVKTLPETVKIDPITGLNFEPGGYLDITALALAFGSADFTVSAIVSPADNAQTSRVILAGEANGLNISLVGDANAMSGIALTVQGASAFNVTTGIPLRNNKPYLITYSRRSGTGYLFLNGVLVDSFADTNNYSGDQAYVGSDTINPGMVKMYGMSFWDIGLTASQAFNLWNYGGNPLAAALGTDLSFNLKFDSRPATKVYESVGAAFINFQGDMAWLSPTSPAN